MKQFRQYNLSDDPMPSCATCECAHLPVTDENTASVFCTRTGTDVSVDNLCEAYLYDLLKRCPRRRPEMPHLDPGLLDD